MAMARTGKQVGRGKRASALALIVALAGAVAWGVRPGRPADPLARGKAAYERGDWEQGLAVARERLRAEPEDVEALRLMARSSARLGRDDLARGIFGERLGMGRMEGEDFYALGLGLLRQDSTTALEVLSRGLHVAPRHPGMLSEVARLEARQDHLIAAVGLAERLAGVLGWEARGDLLAGMLRAELSDPSAAADHLERALRLDPALRGAAATPAQARTLLARSWLRAGQPGRARAILAARPAGGPDPDPESAWLLGRALLQLGDVAGASAATGRSRGGGAGASNMPEPAPYVGSAACAGCHSAVHRSQQGSLHARTYIPTPELGRVDLPARPVVDPADPKVVHTIDAEAGRLRYATRSGEKSLAALVDFAVGSGDRGLSLVGLDGAGQHRELRLSRYHDGSGWDKTTGHPDRPPDLEGYLGRALTADGVRRCLHCHTTDARAARDRVGPTVADRGIGCERCHGPGGNHLKAVELKFPDPAIARPRDFAAARLVRLCGECHSPRSSEVADPAAKASVRFQASTFVASRCFTESGDAFSCLTCHDPHRDASASTGSYEPKCLACHAPNPSPGPAGAPRRPPPCPVSPASGCLECHMPVIKDAVAHSSFTDHYIRVHPRKVGGG